MDSRTKTVQIKELNSFITCVLCGGYFVDATTIVECLHSFCKSCIVRYLEASKFCPICDVQVHHARPLLSIRPDETLQYLVYKLVPGLFTREMKRRRDFAIRNPSVGTFDCWSSLSTQGFGPENVGCSTTLEEEKISVVLQLNADGNLPCRKRRVRRRYPLQLQDQTTTLLDRRCLLCPVVFTVAMIKKFLRLKFELEASHEIEVYYQDGQLSEEHTMMEIAYLCSWNGRGPLTLYYCVFTTSPPTLVVSQSPLSGCESAPSRDSVITLTSETSPGQESGVHSLDTDQKPPNLIINYQANEESDTHSTPNKRHVFNIQPIKEDPDSADAEPAEMTYARRSLPVSIPLKRTITLLDDDCDGNSNDENDKSPASSSPGSIGLNSTGDSPQTVYLSERKESKIAKLRKRLRRHKRAKTFNSSFLSFSRSCDDDSSPDPPETPSDSES